MKFSVDNYINEHFKVFSSMDKSYTKIIRPSNKTIDKEKNYWHAVMVEVPQQPAITLQIGIRCTI